MDTAHEPETILLIAAEAREFSGLERRLDGVTRLDWPVSHAREASHHGQRWLLVANGPGSDLARKAFETASARARINSVVSTGYCGALDPSLAVADIFVPKTPADLLTADRVITTCREKAQLRAQTGASAVDMEAATVRECAAAAGLRFHCVRVVSDTAHEDLPLDLNQARNADGRFSARKILVSALRRPVRRLPALIRLARDSARASETLGEYLAGCEF